MRWEFVYKRPQHLINRLSAKYKVLVVEEPIGFQNNTEVKINKISSSLHVIQPAINQLDELGKYLRKYLKNKKYPVGWFYSASFVGILDTLDFETIVYDCMDELSLFKGAPQKLIEQEEFLLSAADIVFTGGKSLYEAKKSKHYNIHCFPSSVEIDHFSNKKSDIIPTDIKNIAKPIIGYYGVIDERFDIELLREAAIRKPEWSFVIIGPVIKIDPATLPVSPNIHYLGAKTYEELPVYLAGWDVALIPFLLNESTKYISPTKTPEYLASGVPVLSSAIVDVVTPYGLNNLVQIFDDADSFILAGEKELAKKNTERRK